MGKYERHSLRLRGSQTRVAGLSLSLFLSVSISLGGLFGYCMRSVVPCWTDRRTLGRLQHERIFDGVHIVSVWPMACAVHLNRAHLQLEWVFRFFAIDANVRMEPAERIFVEKMFVCGF